MANQELERRLAAILSADVAGYSRLMGEDEQATIRTLQAYRSQIAQLVEGHRGRVVDAPGDNVLAEFPSALDAVSSAVEIQRVLRARNAGLPEARRMEFRIGIHMGDVSSDGERLYGDGVNIAARLEGMADPGGICVSDSVQAQARSRIPVSFEDQGEHEFKNIADPVHVYRVRLDVPESVVRPPAPQRSFARWSVAALAGLALVAGALLWLAWPRGPASTVQEPIRSLAVLPLDNLSGDPAQEFLVDGMTEALTAELAKIKALKVISRTSVMRYKDTTMSMPEIATELGVVGLIEGSVQREGDEVRVTAQLIHGPSDTHLWSASYTDTMTSVLRLQADVAMAIAHEVNAAITPEETSRIMTKRSVDPEAYREWLLGRHLRTSFSPEGFARAADHLERAIAIDPEFAAAHGDLALAYWEPTVYGWRDQNEVIRQVRREIETALALDPDSSEAHAAAAVVALGYDYDWARAERELRRALDLNSDNPIAHKYLVWTLAVARRFDEAITVADRAVQLDPLNIYALDARADAYSHAGRFEESISQRQQILELVPDHEGTLFDLLLVYLAAGQPERAEETLTRLSALRGVDTPQSLAAVRASQGRETEARALLAAQEADTERRRDPLLAAVTWALLEEPEQALDWLERAYDQRDFGLLLLNVEWMRPLFAGLRHHLRYQALIERLDFPG